MKNKSFISMVILLASMSCISSYALTSVSDPASPDSEALTLENGCPPEMKNILMAAAKQQFETEKKNLIALNEAKKAIKPKTGLSCLDNLGLAGALGYPSWSRIVSAITNQVKNKACSEVNQVVSEVSSAVNQSIGFKGIPGIDGQIIDGTGVSIGGGVNSSGRTGIYDMNVGKTVGTPGYLPDNVAKPDMPAAASNAAQSAQSTVSTAVDYMKSAAQNIADTFKKVF
jgi:hypothetical protein